MVALIEEVHLSVPKKINEYDFEVITVSVRKTCKHIGRTGIPVKKQQGYSFTFLFIKYLFILKYKTTHDTL